MSDELPEGWASAQISELCDVPKDKGRENVVPYLEIGNVDVDLKNYSLTDKPSVKGCRVARKHDVLVSKVRPTRGAIILIHEDELHVSSAFTVLRDKGALAEKYLWQFLAWNRDYFNHLSANCTGTMYPTTSDEVVAEYEVPLAPLAEQRRIVAKLETLLGKMDCCQQRLAKIPILLKRFRTSVLAAACSGRLTVDWRSQQTEQGNVQDDIQQLALKQWAEFRVECERALKDGRRKPRTPTCLDTDIECAVPEEFPELPESWSCVPLGRLASNELDSFVDGPFGSAVNTKTDYIDNGVPVVRINNVRPFQFVNENLKYVSQTKFEELSRHNISPGDILLAKVGATIGDCCLYPAGLPTALLSTTGSCRLTAERRLADNRFVCAQLNLRKPHLQWIASAVAQPFLNMATVKSLPFALPPLPEQQEIVRRVEGLFALADQLEVRLAKARGQVDQLTPSLLARAFAGKLVPQHPTDEPADKLLKRITKLQEIV